MKSERDSEIWKDCNAEKVQHEKSATRRQCNKKKVQNENSAQRKKQHVKSTAWRECSMEKMHYRESKTRKKNAIWKMCSRMQHEQSREREKESKIWKKVQKKSAQTDNKPSVNGPLYAGAKLFSTGCTYHVIWYK